MRECHSLVYAFLILSTVFFGGDVLAQNRTGPFAPPVGQSGTTAMYKDSSAFVAWATSCTVERGLQDTSDPSQGYASTGTPSDATGKAQENGVLSLGDYGKATLGFDAPISDGPGPDFAVFENSFDGDFLELAFVEVSSNGQDFVRFPSVSLTDTNQQVGTFGDLDATDLYNLAGKYEQGYGTPFDLNELDSSASFDPDSVTQVRIVDVIGCIQDSLATYDSSGKAINDPWPTGFTSGGFDLDAVGVINSDGPTALMTRNEEEDRLRFFSADRRLWVQDPEGAFSLYLYDSSGRLRFERKRVRQPRSSIPRSLSSGIYILKVQGDGWSDSRKVLLR